MKLTDIDVQRAIINRWQSAGLATLAPAYFDQPPDGTVPPFARLKINWGEPTKHALGQIWAIKITGEVRIPEGDPIRAKVEVLLGEIVRVKPTIGLTTAIHFRQAGERTLEKDDKQYAGVPVDRLPVAWELAFEETW